MAFVRYRYGSRLEGLRHDDPISSPDDSIPLAQFSIHLAVRPLAGLLALSVGLQLRQQLVQLLVLPGLLLQLGHVDCLQVFVLDPSYPDLGVFLLLLDPQSLFLGFGVAFLGRWGMSRPIVAGHFLPGAKLHRKIEIAEAGAVSLDPGWRCLARFVVQR